MAAFATTVPVDWLNVGAKGVLFGLSKPNGISVADVAFSYLHQLASMADGAADEPADRIAGKGYDHRYEETYAEIWQAEFDRALYSVVRLSFLAYTD